MHAQDDPLLPVEYLLRLGHDTVPAGQLAAREVQKNVYWVNSMEINMCMLGD